MRQGGKKVNKMCTRKQPLELHPAGDLLRKNREGASELPEGAGHLHSGSSPHG